MTLKELKERKVELLNSMSIMTENIEVFDSVKFDEFKNELSKVEDMIREFDNAQEIENRKEKESDKKMSELYNKLMAGQEVNLNEIKAEGEHTTQNVGELINDTYANQIEKALRDKCVLYDKARKVVTASPHIIPVEKVVIDKFVKVAELAEYAKKQAQFGQVKLGAEKFGVMVALSEELLQDADYDIEGALMAQLRDAYAGTVNELIVSGDQEAGIEGLAMATQEKGAKVVTVADGVVDEDDIIDLMFALPRAYRDGAMFIVNDAMAGKLAKLRDQEGRPVLQMHGMEMPNLLEGADGVIKGKPCVIAPLPDAKPIMFVNMEKAVVVGLRKDLTIKKSEEAGFMNDSVLIKANCRLDIKLLMNDAIAFINDTTV